MRYGRDVIESTHRKIEKKLSNHSGSQPTADLTKPEVVNRQNCFLSRQEESDVINLTGDVIKICIRLFEKEKVTNDIPKRVPARRLL